MDKDENDIVQIVKRDNVRSNSSYESLKIKGLYTNVFVAGCFKKRTILEQCGWYILHPDWRTHPRHGRGLDRILLQVTQRGLQSQGEVELRHIVFSLGVGVSRVATILEQVERDPCSSRTLMY